MDDWGNDDALDPKKKKGEEDEINLDEDAEIDEDGLPEDETEDEEML